MRLFLAIILCKLTRGVLRLLRRGGTALPGRVALRVCPDALRRLARGVDVALVTGTNGKTTTCRMLEQVLADGGAELFANRSGSNLRQGIAADFVANATLAGRPKKRAAVIECDEAAFRTVCGEVQPKAVVVTNIFRDQLDRFGEVTHTLASIRAGLEAAPDAVLCLNADCSLTSSLSLGLPNPMLFFGMDVHLGQDAAVTDAPRCIRCGAAYEYDWRTFAHLGAFRCTECGYARREPDVAVTEIGCAPGSAVLRAFGEDIPVRCSIPGEYNLYNAAAAVCVAQALGTAPAAAAASLAHVQGGFGRMETFGLDGLQATMILVKNPAGCDRAISYVAEQQGDKLCVICLSDLTADGTDVSWIWDAAFETLTAHCKRFIVSGTRAEDMKVRLKYAGADEDAVKIIRGEDELIEAMRQDGAPVYILPTYTAMLPLRAVLSRLTGRKEFWE